MQKRMMFESFGLSIVEFYEARTAKKKLDHIMLRKSKRVSIFSHLSGIYSFLNSVPQSLHFYPMAKKIYKQENFFEKSELRIRKQVK